MFGPCGDSGRSTARLKDELRGLIRLLEESVEIEAAASL